MQGADSNSEYGHPTIPPSPFSINSRISLSLNLDIPKILKAQNKHLLNIALMFPIMNQKNEKALLRFSDKNMKNCRWLEGLALETKFGSKLTQNQIIQMITSLQTNQSLTHLKFVGQILNQGHFIIPHLRNFKRLQHLTLDFSNFWGSLPPIYRIFSLLKDLGKLKVIKVSFGYIQSADSHRIKELGLGISRLKTIKALYLELNQIYSENKNFSRLASVSSEWRVCEPAFILNFKPSGGITNQIFETIIENLKHLPRLEKFQFSTGCYSEISNQQIEAFSRFLPDRLKSLRLDFSYCQEITKAGILSLLMAIAKMSCLQDISLKFCSRSEIDDEVTRELLRCLSRQKSLESLFIELGSCKMITESAMTRFLTFIPSNSTLKSLMLSFTKFGKNLTDEGLGKLGVALANLKRLETFALNCGGCSGVTDNGINKLSIKFGSLEKLKKLALVFRDCITIRGTTISENLFRELEKPKDLEFLILDLRFCKRLDQEKVRRILPWAKPSKYKLLVYLK